MEEQPEYSKGLRFNDGKPKWSLVDFDSLLPMVKVLEYGVQKYAKDNWKKGMPITEITESLLRHTFALLNGEDIDKESGISHIGHIQCNAMFIGYMMQNKQEFDDRVKGVVKNFGNVHPGLDKIFFDPIGNPLWVSDCYKYMENNSRDGGFIISEKIVEEMRMYEKMEYSPEYAAMNILIRTGQFKHDTENP